jgi:hypothetical protein
MTNITKSHQKKFEGFIKACKYKKADLILVAALSALWDTVQEVEHNIEIARYHGKVIRIVSIWAVIS